MLFQAFWTEISLSSSDSLTILSCSIFCIYSVAVARYVTDYFGRLTQPFSAENGLFSVQAQVFFHDRAVVAN